MKKNSEDVEQRLRHKPVILEGFQTAQRSKKPKRKEMSAREKRIRGIYKISPKGQRLGYQFNLCLLWTSLIPRWSKGSLLFLSDTIKPCFTAYTSLLHRGYYTAAQGYEFYL